MNHKKPTALKVLQGNPGRRPLPENEPVLKVEIPRPPPNLSKEAKKHYRKVAKQLADCKVLTLLDGDALAIYCEAYARWSRAHDELTKDPDWIVYTEKGYPMTTPWLAISSKAFDQMRALLAEFGMTPASRTKVSTVGGDGKKDDPWSTV